MFSMDFLVKEFLFDCRVRSLSEQTILNYKKQLGHFVRFLETECKVTNIEDLKPLHIKLFIRHYQERQCKPSYVNDNLKAVKTLCAYAQREGYVDELITKNIKNGLDLYSLSRLLGHESVTVTQRYLESMEDSEIINNAAKTSVLAHL